MRCLLAILSAALISLLFFGCGPSKHRQIDVYLTVESWYGDPSPPRGENYLNYGMTLIATVDSTLPAGDSIRYACAGWTGTGSVPAIGAANYCQFTITQNSAITWLWKTQYELTVEILPEGSGTVGVSPAGEDSYYDDGRLITLTANANTGYIFGHWSGNLSSNNNPETLSMNGPKSVTANFILTGVANFTGTPRSGAPPLTVQFTDTSTAVITSWAWDFDNNGTIDSTEQHPSYTYNNSGIYTVRLTVAGPGVSDYELKTRYIIVGIWAKSYGGTGEDIANSIRQTSDGGYIVAGNTRSFGAGIYDDFWVLKLNKGGAVAWQKRYGGASSDYATSIQQTTDGGYIVAGTTNSFGSGLGDFWLLKLSSDGAISWQKTYGGSKDEYATFIQQTTDGGYVVAGFQDTGWNNYHDLWVLKLNSDGTVVWRGAYSDRDSFATSIKETTDGGYIVAGHAAPYNYPSPGYSDFWVLKLNSNGTIGWQKKYGGTVNDRAYSVDQTSDGGYIVAGYTYSFGAGNCDMWVIKLDTNGAVSWQKTYGAASDDFAASIQQTNDGGYIVAGSTRSFGAGYSDFWVLKLNSDGAVAWQKRYGGAGEDIANSIQQTHDGCYVVAGTTRSFGAGWYDFWVLKLDSDGTILFSSASGAHMADTNAAPVNTAASVSDSAATAQVTSASVANTSAAAVDTNATVLQQAP